MYIVAYSSICVHIGKYLNYYLCTEPRVTDIPMTVVCWCYRISEIKSHLCPGWTYFFSGTLCGNISCTILWKCHYNYNRLLFTVNVIKLTRD